MPPHSTPTVLVPGEKYPKIRVVSCDTHGFSAIYFANSCFRIPALLAWDKVLVLVLYHHFHLSTDPHGSIIYPITPPLRTSTGTIDTTASGRKDRELWKLKGRNTVARLARAHRTLQSKPQRPDHRFPIFSTGGCSTSAVPPTDPLNTMPPIP